MAGRYNKEGKCKDCNKSFLGEVKYLAKGLCQTCYARQWYRNIPVADDATTQCTMCGGIYGKKDDKGRPIVKKNKQDTCKRCYTRNTRADLTQVCSKCGAETTGKSASKVCKVCRYEENVKQKKKNYKNIPKVKPTKHQYLMMNYLLVRYKMGWNNAVDAFIVADLYTDLHSEQVSVMMDAYKPDSQVMLMLKKFGELYEARRK
jgi:hypothetical protein